MSQQTIGRYQSVAESGCGRMATVYRAHDSRIQRDVAIKVLDPRLMGELRQQARFAREARIIATLEHPAIVPVYDYGEEDGRAYLVMCPMPGPGSSPQARGHSL